MSLRGRVNRLVAAARRQGLSPGAGCPACRERRNVTVIMRGREDDAGEMAWAGEGPSPCAACGQVPEEVIEVVEQVVETRDQARAWLRGDREGDA